MDGCKRVKIDEEPSCCTVGLYMCCVEFKKLVDANKVKASVCEAWPQNECEFLYVGRICGPFAVPDTPETLKTVKVCRDQTIVVERQRQITSARGRGEINIGAHGGREVHLERFALERKGARVFQADA